VTRECSWRLVTVASARDAKESMIMLAHRSCGAVSVARRRGSVARRRGSVSLAAPHIAAPHIPYTIHNIPAPQEPAPLLPVFKDNCKHFQHATNPHDVCSIPDMLFSFIFFERPSVSGLGFRV